MIDKMLENVECHLDDIEMVIFIMLPSVIHPIWRRMNILQFSPYLALLCCNVARLRAIWAIAVPVEVCCHIFVCCRIRSLTLLLILYRPLSAGVKRHCSIMNYNSKRTLVMSVKWRKLFCDTYNTHYLQQNPQLLTLFGYYKKSHGSTTLWVISNFPV